MPHSHRRPSNRYPFSLQRLLPTLLLCAALATPAFGDLTDMRGPLFGATDNARARADSTAAALLAPTSYEDAIEAYQRADEVFQRGGSIDAIRRHLARADEHFAAATEAAQVAAVAFDSVIDARRDAQTADAARFAADSWRSAEEYFDDATRRLERGSMQSAERAAVKAESAYRAGELAAIKANWLSEARRLIDEADELRAPRYAPVSLERAQRLLVEAETALNEDRYDTDRPRSLAADARHWAKHAIYVSELERAIRRGDTQLETILLAWEGSLARLGDALDTPVWFDDGEQQAIDALLARVEGLQSERAEIANELSDRRAELARMQELLGGGNQTIAELEELLERQARHRERFARVERLFDRDDAIVLRQGDTVIIRMIGLNFDSGAARLKAEHEPLLGTLQQAISIFPESRVRVEGHTDAFGSDQENLRLSQSRADVVVNHLLSTLPISPAKLEGVGYGEAQPVANNETAEGRRRNRRIDVVLEPSWSLPAELARQ